MTGDEVTLIRKALGMTNEQLKDKLGVGARTMTSLQASGVIIEKRYELAVRALWFKVDEKPIVVTEVVDG